jgi:hypothetical protein
MIDLKIVKCKYCKHFKAKEFSINTKFIDPYFDNKIGYDVISRGPIKACNNKICFESKPKNDPVNGPTKTTERILGQAQLNKNNECGIFKISILGRLLWLIDSLNLKFHVTFCKD